MGRVSPQPGRSTCPTAPSARSISPPGAGSRSATACPPPCPECRCDWPATGCAWHSASTGAAPARARGSCSAWWCPPVSAADSCWTACPMADAPVTPGMSAMSSSTRTGRSATAADADASKPSPAGRTWSAGPASRGGPPPRTRAARNSPMPPPAGIRSHCGLSTAGPVPWRRWSPRSPRCATSTW